jgi:hypothetical protein
VQCDVILNPKQKVQVQVSLAGARLLLRVADGNGCFAWIWRGTGNALSPPYLGFRALPPVLVSSSECFVSPLSGCVPKRVGPWRILGENSCRLY